MARCPTSTGAGAAAEMDSAPRRWRLCSALVSGSAAFLLACSPGPSPDILLLTLDTTRSDAVGAFGGARARTPRLDALAGEALRFTQAITTAPYTGPSHASMHTGLLPPQHGLRDFLQQALPEQAVTLAESLRSRGYQTAAFVSAYVLDPRYGLDQGFDVYSSVRQPRGHESFTERPAVDTVDEVLRWVRERDVSRPFFLWIHLFDPHHPYRPPEEFRSPLPAGIGRLERQRARYLDEAAYMDAEIGRALDEFDRIGLLENLVIVAVADHGEMIGERGYRPGTHSPVLFDLTLRVPLFVRAPGRVDPGAEDRQVSVVDVFPTILELAGLAVPEGIEGRSLLREASSPRPAYSETFYEHHPGRAEVGQELVSLRLDGWKLITGPGRSELYDLRSDPNEERDVSSQHPQQVERLRAVLIALAKRWPEEAVPRALELDPAEVERHLDRLRSLGYVE